MAFIVTKDDNLVIFPQKSGGSGELAIPRPDAAMSAV